MRRPTGLFLTTARIFLYAGLVGAVGGLAVVGFRWLLDRVQSLVTGSQPGVGTSIVDAARQLAWWQCLLVPAGGGLAAGLIVRFLVRHSSAFGISDIMEVVSLRRGGIRNRPTFARVAASILTLASGGSVGREGATVQLGSTIAANIGKWTHLDPRHHGILLGCGVAAGLAGAYNAPLAGAFFVMEVILGNFAMDVFAPVVVASVVSTLVTRGLQGGDIAVYAMPAEIQAENLLVGPGPVLAALALGVPAGIGAVLFMKLLKEGGRAFKAIRMPLPLKTMGGGLLVGAIGIWRPEVWGGGYHATSDIVQGADYLDVPLLCALLLLKPIATTITVGSGGVGGVFTPVIMVGATMGSLFATGLEALFPGFAIYHSGFVVAGMAGMTAGTTHAPIMSMMLLLEMTQNHHLVLPLMLTTITSSVVSRLLMRDSVYTERLRARGVPVDAGIEELTLHATYVRDLMHQDLQTIPVTATLDQILQRFTETRRDVIYVVGEDRVLLGHVNLHDVKGFMREEGLGNVVIAADVMRTPPTVPPGDSIAQVIEHFDDPELEELPVVETRKEGTVLIGRITRRDLIACMNLEVLKRQSLRAKFVVEGERKADYVELPKGYSLTKLAIPAELLGKTIAQSGLREKFHLTVLSIVETDPFGVERRIVPDSTSVLTADHALVVIGRAEDIDTFRARKQA